LDLAALPEADAAHQPVRDAAAAEHVLERSGLRVDAVQNREVATAAAFGDAQPRDLVRDVFGLFDLVVQLGGLHALSTQTFRPDPLRCALLVVADDVVSGV